jgi:hypothetical protein
MEPLIIRYTDDSINHILVGEDSRLYIEEVRMAYSRIDGSEYPSSIDKQLELLDSIKIETK